MRALARNIKYKFKYFLWTLNGYYGKQLSIPSPQKVTVLITYYNPIRMEHVNSQIRNVLKCDFVEKVIISNHNPNICIDKKIKAEDNRLIILNQDIRRGCGYRWVVASKFNPDFLIVVDDDILLFPLQIKELFIQLLSDQNIPHGFTGFLHNKNNHFEYHERENITVDYLCEIYAVTKSHLKRYSEIVNFITKDKALIKLIEFEDDFMVISQSGSYNPQIHNTSRLFRCPTFKRTGIAIHMEAGFNEGMSDVYNALSSIDKRI